MRKYLFAILVCSLLATLSFTACSNSEEETTEEEEEEVIVPKTFKNPVIHADAPDPTVIRAKDGKFYAFTTWDNDNVPVYCSEDMVNWKKIGDAFGRNTVPNHVKGAGIWAPDINYIDGKYVLYFSMSAWGGEWDCGICRAVSRNPEGPYIESKLLFTSREIGVQNSIDPVVYQENGKKYLIWGSFRGLYLTELTSDGLELADPENLLQIAGTWYEGAYIHKRGSYYYLFASIGSCCNELESTYQAVVGRSTSLFGPYVNKKGEKMLDNRHEIILSGNAKVKGPGHDSQIITDDKGNDWILYHGWDVSNPQRGRKMYLDRVRWDSDGWPTINNGAPSSNSYAPVFNSKE